MIPIAERRMFSKRIINSARFLKMPVSSQCLYFHLGLHADDDGIVEAYTVMNSVGASEDDLKILVVKGFLLVLNDDLVSYITDWRENNKIRADRKVDSIYKDLLVQMLPEVELLEARNRMDNENRSKMYKESKLPNKFLGVMRGLFYGERCPICGCKMEDGNTKPSIQHNLPISKGGKHEIDNISVICLSCNMSLKDKETGELNNALVKEKWEHYLAATCEDSVRTTKGLTEDGIGKDRIGKVSIGEDSISPPKATKPTRHKYGEYKNVLLSDEDMEKLKAEFPSDWQRRIERLSGYIASTGKSYKNHLATIRNWAKRDKEKGAAEKKQKNDGWCMPNADDDIDLTKIFG